jgi:glycosyltransferase involved in cell wall biosynthesis
MTHPTAPPRVLLLTETYWPEVGGGERQTGVLAHGLMRRGYDVTVVARRSRPGLPRRDNQGGTHIARLSPTGKGRLRKWLMIVSAFVYLLRKRRHYDIVLVSGFRLLGIAALLARALSGKRTVLKADSSGEMSGDYFRAGLARFRLTPEAWPVTALLRARNALLRHADAFVSLSRETTQELIAHGVPAGSIQQIGNAVDTDAFRTSTPDERAELRRRLDLPSGLIVVYTGRLVTYKGLLTLLAAWRNVQATSVDATLVLIGEGGADIHACEDALRDYVTAHGLGESVRFTGAVSNVQDWLRAADAFVFPTENEAFGLSLVEAMACGLPSVTTMVGGIADYVVDDINAMAVPPGEPDALATALREMLHDAVRRQRLGAAARRTAVQHFSVAAVTDAYASLLTEQFGVARTVRRVQT